MKDIQTILSILVIASLSTMSLSVSAMEDEHKGHVMKQAPAEHGEHDGPYYGVSPSNQNNNALQKLDSIPPSGHAREASSDGRYNMEPTTVKNDLHTLCAQGSRGLIMLDNDTWKKCGGKPEGAARGAGYYPAIPPWNKEGKGNTEDASGAIDHSMH